jgi:DNA-binding HxlR family transcriptional regulator
MTDGAPANAATPGLAATAAMPASAEDAAMHGSADVRSLRSPCPVANALDVVGDRWTLLVIRDLFAGKRRFGDFLRSPEHIPTNVLAERLKRLEHAGLMASVPYQERPRRLEYHLTPRGRELSPILDALAVWGLVQFPGTRPPSR